MKHHRKYMPLGLYEPEEYEVEEYEVEEYAVEEYKVEEYICEIYEEYGINSLSDREIKRIEKEFERKTSIVNKTDLIFLGIATAIFVTKGLLFGQIASKKGYGSSFDKSKRLPHDDKSITDAHRKGNDAFKDKGLEKHGTGKWLELVYQTPPYDITKGSPAIGRNMEGGYHRIHTLGHDPVLGWIFGTLNILTDTITYEDFASYRVERRPTMRITSERIYMPVLIKEAYNLIRDEAMCLPAAVFAQFMHLQSDRYTKLGLPVPVLETFAPEFAGKLYKSQYDELCALRDMKIIADSASIAILFNMIIGLIHQLFYDEKKDDSKELYEVRTRKIILISNTIGSTSNILQTVITKNPKNLDIGGLLVTISRLFSDLRFIAKIKAEFINNELNGHLWKELSSLED